MNLRPLLQDDEPNPVRVVNPDATGPFLLVCEHAGNLVPAALSGLGIAATDLDKHIGHDIGAAAVAEDLADKLGSALILQRYSRLVIDCNRPWGAPDLVPDVADGVVVSGNHDLSETARRRRFDEIHVPLHDTIAERIDRLRPKALVAVHSFTEALSDGVLRTLDLGLLYNRDSRLAEALHKAVLAIAPGTHVAMNVPYHVEDTSDVTIPVHGEARGLPHVLIEIRNDLIADTTGQRAWGELLANALLKALSSVR
ncbi:N-formylglutamate amidohydrolase [Hoeflea prorocentri]|uniref:N-formylglutamate amidohydrolase n=1 Tax=Hoeflea prorocentri TaxID=1922333 RepID=A0A9X3UJ55_9HYPH|nr:N-formylglutamate amidohydrolase [Hoeflea prorocentri]MCY6381803.1 N-formylglutamate amidohydrolase [Hoeflea prorocentri]MDA5399603.1 N-formylglutamate amidohydrolase [Hoeflea prorocentri]